MGEYFIKIVAFAVFGLLAIAIIGWVVETCQKAWLEGNKLPAIFWIITPGLVIGFLAAWFTH